MKKFLLGSLFIIFILGLFPSSATSEDKITYQFDDIFVSCAMEFDATPVKVQEGSWIEELAGGMDKSVRITYGKVNFILRDIVRDSEEQYIKITGENGVERYLCNSASYEYYEGSNLIKSCRLQFWSGKQMENNVVVKDFSKPVKAVFLNLYFDMDQKISSAMLEFTEGDAKEIGGIQYSRIPLENNYEGDIKTLVEAGSLTDTPQIVTPAATPTEIPTEIPSYIPDMILYDFTGMDVVFSMDFTANTDSDSGDSWVSAIAGGKDKPIQITYGKVNLTKDGQPVGTEQYIEVAGENGVERFLCNETNENDIKDHSSKEVRTLFWEGTKIVDNVIVKVNSDIGRKVVFMDIRFNHENKIKRITLSFGECDWKDAQDYFRKSVPFSHKYTGELKTLQLIGKM